MSNDSKFGLKVYLRDTDAMLFAPSIDMFADTKIKLIIGNAGGTNTIVVRGRIQGQRDWDEIGSIVGNDTAEFNTKTYDFIQLECTVYDSPTNYLEVTGSGFNLASGIFESITTPAGTLSDVETLEFISSDDSVSIATVSPNKIDLTANFGGGGVVTSVNGEVGAVIIDKSDVGLSNVDNTSDANKPVSTAQQTALNLKQNLSEKGSPNGYASLDGGGKIPASQLPNSVMELQGAWNAATNSPLLADGSGNPGDLYKVTTAGTQDLGSGSITYAVNDFVIYGADGVWFKSDSTDAVISVNGLSGVVNLSASDIPNIASGNIVATDVQAAINELDSEKEPTITVLPVSKGGTNSSAVLANNKLMYSSVGTIIEKSKSEIGVLDAFNRPKLWYYDTDSIFKLGSWQTDGDTTNENSEGAVIYGVSVTGNPINAGNGGYARIKSNRFGLFTIDSTLPAYSGGDYYFRVDGTSLFLKNNSAVKSFEVNRTTGAIKTSMGAGVVSSDASGNLTSSTAITTDLTNLKGQKLIRLFQGGEYASLQAAHDAAAAGDTILVGPSSSSWGDVVISKQLSIIGISGDRNISVTIGAVSFNLTNANSNLNEVHLKNLFIAPSGSTSPISVPANAFAPRIRIEQCYIYSNSGSNDLVVFSNTTSGASMYIYDCALNAGPSHTGIVLHTLGGYVFVRRSSIDGGAKGIKVDGGTTQLDSTTIEYANTSEAVQVTGGTFISAVGLIRNLNSAGSGINMTSPAVVVLGNQTFDVTSGTGHCVKGTGFLLYDNVSFSDSALGASNTSFQNTLTIAPYTTTITKSLALKAPLASPTFTGTVSGITKAMVGLSNVDNTSDATKNSAVATLTNKTIDANGTGNSISNLEVADFAAGVIDTDLTTVSGSDNTLPSAKAVKTYVDAAVLAPTVKYIKTVALVDWGSPSGGEYTLTIPFSSHGIPNPLASCYETNGATFDFLICPVNVDASNNITIKVNETPDARFIGKIVIE